MGPWGETPAARANWVDVAAGPPRRRALSVPRVARALDGRGAAELARHGVRGDVRRVHEYARAVGVEVRGHAVDLLHDLAHGVERAGRDLVARAVDLPLHVVGRADLVVVRRARGRARVLVAEVARRDVARELAAAKRLDELVAALVERALVVVLRAQVPVDVGGALVDVTVDGGVRGEVGAELAHGADRDIRGRLLEGLVAGDLVRGDEVVGAHVREEVRRVLALALGVAHAARVEARVLRDDLLAAHVAADVAARGREALDPRATEAFAVVVLPVFRVHAVAVGGVRRGEGKSEDELHGAWFFFNFELSRGLTRLLCFQ